MAELGLKFIYENGSANENRLDLYDGAVSLEGIARAITITTHAFINGEIRTHGDAAHGAKFYLRPSQRGSYVFDVLVWTADAYAAGVFYDFVKYGFQEAIGLADGTTEPSLELQRRIEPTIGELPAVLESPLHEVHRPIRQAREMTLKVTRPRGEVLITFNAETAAYLQPHTISLAEPIIGNVTRYNTLSRWGKFFDRAKGRTVSFCLQPSISERERSLITWSLHESNLNRSGTLYLTATAVVTPTNHVKRYNVINIHQPSA